MWRKERSRRPEPGADSTRSPRCATSTCEPVSLGACGLRCAVCDREPGRFVGQSRFMGGLLMFL